MAMKAREIRERLKDYADPRIVHILCGLAEDANVMRQQIFEMAQQMDQHLNILQNFTQIAENMKSTVDSMKAISKTELDDTVRVGSEKYDARD